MSTYMLMSGFLTNKSISQPSYYNMNEFKYSKLDQLLSTLCSLKKLKLDYADFYLDYDEEFVDNRKIVENFIQVNFKSTEYRLFNFRLEFFSQWQQAAKIIPHTASTVLLMSNLDHVFIPQKINRYLEFLEFLVLKEETAIGQILHWQENITAIGSRKLVNLKNISPVFQKKSVYTHGTILVKPEFFKSWWIQDFTQGERIVRPDNPFGPWVYFAWANCYIPSTEFFRHLDGYGHVGITSPHASNLRPCCQFSNGSVIHDKWVIGFEQNKYAELPFERPTHFFSKLQKTQFSQETKDYLLNSNSAVFSFIRSKQLLGNLSFFTNLRLFFLLLSYLRFAYMRSAFYRNFFNLSRYKLRIDYHLATKKYWLSQYFERFHSR